MPFGLLVAGLAPRTGSFIVRRLWRQWLVRLLVLALAWARSARSTRGTCRRMRCCVLGAFWSGGWRAPGPLGRRLRQPWWVAAAQRRWAGRWRRSWRTGRSTRTTRPRSARAHGGVVGRFLGWVRMPALCKPWLLIWGFFLFLALSYVTVELLARRVSAEVHAGEQAARRARHASGCSACCSCWRCWRSWPRWAGRPSPLAALPLCLAVPLILDRRAELRPRLRRAAARPGPGRGGGNRVGLPPRLPGGRRLVPDEHSLQVLRAGVALPGPGRRLHAGPALVAHQSRALPGSLCPGRWPRASSWPAGWSFLFVGVRDSDRGSFPGAQPPLGHAGWHGLHDCGRVHLARWQTTVSCLSGEYEALKWLLANVTGTPVVAEAPAGSYTVRPTARPAEAQVSLRLLSGRWIARSQHDRTCRPSWASTSTSSVRRAGGGPDRRVGCSSSARRTWLWPAADGRAAGASYIYVGGWSDTCSVADALRKFDVLAEAGELAVAYRNDDVTIYRVSGEVTIPALA